MSLQRHVFLQKIPKNCVVFQTIFSSFERSKEPQKGRQSSRFWRSVLEKQNLWTQQKVTFFKFSDFVKDNVSITSKKEHPIFTVIVPLNQSKEPLCGNKNSQRLFLSALRAIQNGRSLENFFLSALMLESFGHQNFKISRFLSQGIRKFFDFNHSITAPSLSSPYPTHKNKTTQQKYLCTS